MFVFFSNKTPQNVSLARTMQFWYLRWNRFAYIPKLFCSSSQIDGQNITCSKNISPRILPRETSKLCQISQIFLGQLFKWFLLKFRKRYARFFLKNDSSKRYFVTENAVLTTLANISARSPMVFSAKSGSNKKLVVFSEKIPKRSPR